MDLDLYVFEPLSFMRHPGPINVSHIIYEVYEVTWTYTFEPFPHLSEIIDIFHIFIWIYVDGHILITRSV